MSAHDDDMVTVGVIVRAKIPVSEAPTVGEALSKITAAVRDGIGDEPRKWDMAIAAGGVRGVGMRINESLLHDLTDELAMKEDAPTNTEVEQIVDAAVRAARHGLRKVIGTSPAAYDLADKFMETFEPHLRTNLEAMEDA